MGGAGGLEFAEKRGVAALIAAARDRSTKLALHGLSAFVPAGDRGGGGASGSGGALGAAAEGSAAAGASDAGAGNA